MEIETNRPKLKRQEACDKRVRKHLAEGLKREALRASPKRQASRLMQKASNERRLREALGLPPE